MSDLDRLAAVDRQIKELEVLIAESRLDGDVVGRVNFSKRLEVVKREREALQRQDSQVGEIAVLFDGAPVYGKACIDASFAAQAISLFQAIVTRLFATNLEGTLASRGKIRGSNLASLNIRGVATGSFGFVFEEKDATQASAIRTPIRESIESAVSLFEEFTQEDEDGFLVDVEHMNPRVFLSLSRFFRHLETNSATLKTNLPDRSVAFDQAGINRAYKRISSTRVKIEPVLLSGRLVGLSPIQRTFDFKRDDTGEMISGKFSHQISQDYLERIESDQGITLGDRFDAKIEIATIVKPDGTSSTSYTVTDLSEQ